MSFGKNLLTALDMLGVSRSEFSVLIGHNRQDANRWINCGSLPRESTLRKIHEFGISLDYLMTGTGYPFTRPKGKVYDELLNKIYLMPIDQIKSLNIFLSF